ncbi:MAG: hypothetical protein QOF51_605 [Chloroflexota bacterium]|nr:hypothetical protein [Chloroflexota bacterium]
MDPGAAFFPAGEEGRPSPGNQLPSLGFRLTGWVVEERLLEERVAGAEGRADWWEAHGRGEKRQRALEQRDQAMMADLFQCEVPHEVPLGILGRLADSLFVGRYMRRLLKSRASFLKTVR